MLVPVDMIVLGSRIRDADPDAVRALAESVAEVGLLNPLTVSKTAVVRDGRARDGFMLIAGLHRLEAVRSLGWSEVEVSVTDLDGPRAIIAECDENLCNAKLTPAQRALFMRRRKEAYEAMHPETRNGAIGNGREKVRQLGEATPAERFTLDTAAKTGRSERTVQRDAERGERIPEPVLQEISGTDLDNGTILDRIAKAPSPADEVTTIRKEREMGDTKSRKKPAQPAKDNRYDAIVEFLIARLGLSDLCALGEMTAGVCDPLSQALLSAPDFLKLNKRK